jgi:hypothetical protein
VLRWLRRWRERDDQRLIEPPLLGKVDLLEELIRVVNEAQEHDAHDERRLYEPKLEERSPSFQRRQAK